MDIRLKEEFLSLWKKYFSNAELPIVFYYTDKIKDSKASKSSPDVHCLIANLAKVRNGQPMYFDSGSIGCGGGKRYLGFAHTLRPNFEYFLSCGIAGKMEGERYKKSPELVKKLMANMPDFKAPKEFIVFKRWDLLEESDEPQSVIFFAVPDVLSGLFTLAGFDESEHNAVISPFGAGCASIVGYPALEAESKTPRCVIGMFDISARPFVQENVLSFTAPINKFTRMVNNMDESFLITPSWNKVYKRIAKSE